MQTIVEIPKTEEQIRSVWGMGYKPTEQETVQVVIKLPEDTYRDIIKNGFIYDEDNEIVTHVIKNGTLIPDNATNGDVLKMMFPNADIEIHNITVYVIFDMRSNVISFDLKWWNAPYTKGDKE